MLDRKRIETFLAIPKKANIVLQILSLLLFCIVLRLVYLTVYEHQLKEKQEHMRTQRVVLEAPLRGTIQDRFGITLARNQVMYQISIVWADIVEHVPRCMNQIDASGTSSRILLRKKYVSALAHMLAKTLTLDAQRIEDVIYSYAVFSHSVPVPIKKGLTEQEFYKLNAKVRLWPGLRLERTSVRVYPKENSACHIVGYTDSLSKEEYDAVVSEIHTLRTYLKAKEVEEEVELPMGITSYFHAKERLEQLERCGYGMFDSVGKAGIEASFDEQLRGIRGCKKYITNARGDVIAQSASSSRSLSGKRIKLTLSSELQEYCEKLLLMTEKERQEWWQEKHDKKTTHQTSPLFRGGAIVVIDPKTKEVIALASTPRFNPNELSRKSDKTLLLQQHKAKPIAWLRGESTVEALWDGIIPLTKEKSEKDLICSEEELFLDWEHFLSIVCSNRPFILKALGAHTTAAALLEMQQDLFELSAMLHLEPKQLIEKLVMRDFLAVDNESSLKLERMLKVLDTRNVQEACLLFDLGRLVLYPNKLKNWNLPQPTLEIQDHRNSPGCPQGDGDGRVARDAGEGKTDSSTCLGIHQEQMTKSLIQAIGSYRLSTINQFARAKSYLLRLFEEAAFQEFQRGPFQTWRRTHERSFLQEQRKEEERDKKRGQPYLLYLDRECHRQFVRWWKDSSDILLKACAGVISEETLTRPLKHALTESLQRFFKTSSVRVQKDCFAFFVALRKCADAHVEDAFIASLQSYRDLGYPLISKYRVGGTMEHIKTGKELVASIFTLSPPPTLSFAFSQVSPPGSIFKLVTAYTALQEYVMEKKEAPTSNLFVFKDQVFRQNSKVYVGYDHEGKPIPQVYKGGRIPKSLNYHIGMVDMVGALAHSSNPYFALLADEKIRAPEDLVSAARSLGYGERSGLCLPMEAKGRVPNDVAKDKTSLYTTAIGQHTLLATPLQSALMLSALTTDGSLYAPKLVQMALGRDVKGGRSWSDIAFGQQSSLLRPLGLDFPLFLETVSRHSPYRVYIPKAKCRKKLRLDPKVKDILLQGMEAAVEKLKRNREALRGDFKAMPFVWKAFIESRGMVGKSSTAESLETIGLCLNEPPFMYSHTAFGAVFFDDDKGLLLRKSPSLVVVVFLRYGKFGKQAAPLAAAVREEWLNIQKRHAEVK